MILVTGGSTSGKSLYAENRITEYLRCTEDTAAAGERIPTYLATMRGGGAEAQERIRKHRRQREGKGFRTVECPVQIRNVFSECTEVVLLEDLGNLTANEMFGENYEPEVAERIFSQISELDDRCRLLVVVTDEVFSDGGDYDEQTIQYLRELAKLNRLCAGKAKEVWEVVCGIPLAAGSSGSLTGEKGCARSS